MQSGKEKYKIADVTFITGNANKAKYFSELVGYHINHHKVDVPEIQSLNLEEVVAQKARAAYKRLKTPVLVEDTKYIINSFGKLPGTFIKFFLEELGPEKICRLADISADRSVIAGAAFAYYDGKDMKIFKSELSGSIPSHPKGDAGFGWNPIFIPKDSNKTLGEMEDETFKQFYVQIKPFAKVKEFLDTLYPAVRFPEEPLKAA
jgi:non-canonical purine NTP pyrophosphatase (RdgB/HAM1 family)